MRRNLRRFVFAGVLLQQDGVIQFPDGAFRDALVSVRLGKLRQRRTGGLQTGEICIRMQNLLRGYRRLAEIPLRTLSASCAGTPHSETASPWLYGNTSVARKYSGSLSKTGNWPAPDSMLRAMVSSSTGESASDCPALRARYSAISHEACPSITASRASEPSSLFCPAG